jgi:hypothetical protein
LSSKRPKLRERRSRPRLGFTPISLDDYVRKHLASNRGVDERDLRSRLKMVLAAKNAGQLCQCGEEVWVLGSAEVGLMCFTCITGEATPDNDYELYDAR